MKNNQDKTLKTLFKGASIIFLGSIFGYFINFIYRIIISRYLGPEEYGLISLGQMVLNIGLIFSIFGLGEGIIRFGAYFRGKNNLEKVKGTFYSAIWISLPLSIILCILLLLFSDFISAKLFHIPEFKPILIVFALMIPVYVILRLFSAIFLSFKKAGYKELTRTIFPSTFNIIIVSIVVYLGLSILYISISYLLALVLSLILIFLLYLYKIHTKFFVDVKPAYDYKKLLSFSLPLLFVGIFIHIMGWADTFFLGLFRTSAEVGIYNVAFPLAAAMGMFLISFGQIFYPLSSELLAKNKKVEIRKLFEVIIRWIFLITFPVFLLMVLFPKGIIHIFFGKEYVSGSSALMILVLGYFLNVISGPGIHVLKSFKKVKFIFYLNLIVVTLNIILNILLIPIYGITGAAIATASSIVLRQIVIFLKTKSLIKFSYDIRYYLKYIISACASLFIICLIIETFFKPYSFIELIISLIVFGILYILFLFLSKAFGKEDFMIMSTIEKKLGLNLRFVKKILRRFI